MRGLWLPVVAVVAVGMLTGCSGTDDSGGAAASSSGAVGSGAPAKGGEAPATAQDVKIIGSGVEDHATWGPGAYVVRYEVTNSGDVAASYFVGLEFLDADGDVLGSTGVTADKLGPGKAHRGDTAPLAAEITNGKIGDIASVRVSEVVRT